MYLGIGGLMAALTAEWFVSGFEPATEAIGIPAAFAALVLIPLLGNVAENYVALRYAWNGDGDGAMSVIMHSVVQIGLLMVGLLVIVSQFVGRTPLSLQLDPVLTVSLGLALIVLWMIMYDGEMQPVEAVGLIAVYAILAAAIWAEGSRQRLTGPGSVRRRERGAAGSGSFSPTTTPSSSHTPMRRNFARRARAAARWARPRSSRAPARPRRRAGARRDRDPCARRPRARARRCRRRRARS